MFSPKKFNGNVRIEGTKSHTQVNIVHKNRNWHKPFARCAIHYSFYNWQCVLWPCCLWLQFSDISSSGRSFIMHWNSFEKTVIICKQIGYSRIALTEAKFNPSHYLCVRFFLSFLHNRNSFKCENTILWSVLLHAIPSWIQFTIKLNQNCIRVYI